MNDLNLFGRLNTDGYVAIFAAEGEAVTRIDANVYPVGSDVSARYEHPAGIVLRHIDAILLGIDF